MPYHLQRQISRLKKMILGLGALVEDNVHSAIVALASRDADLAQKVIENDVAIDTAELDVEEECLHTLALDTPVANDLRFVIAILKINNDLERIGDLAVNIAEQAIYLSREPRVQAVPFDLRGMGERVETMLRTSLDALVNIDADKAHAVRELDNEVDAIHRGMYERVEAAIRDRPAELEQMIHLLNVSRNLERIADHATNVAKDVLYLATGEIVRHRRARAARERERQLQNERAAATDEPPRAAG